MQEYGFRVEREKKESERKQIEANGIRDFQQTVTQGISDSYVRWRGIEATLATCAVAQHQDRDHRQRQGRPAGHPRQRRYADAAQSARRRPQRRRPRAPLPDNSEAARQQPAGASPPLLEKTPASNLPGPPNGRRRPRCRARRRTGRRAAPPNSPDSTPGRRRASTPAAPPRAAHVLDMVRDPGPRFRGRWVGLRRRHRRPGAASAAARSAAAPPPASRRRRGRRLPPRAAGAGAAAADRTSAAAANGRKPLWTVGVRPPEARYTAANLRGLAQRELCGIACNL